MTSIVTKGGDKGETGLYGGRRVPKDHPRIRAVGAVDELNGFLGLAAAEPETPVPLRDDLNHLQHLLFRVGADLATPLDAKSRTNRIEDSHVKDLEARVTAIESTLPAQTKFLLPGGTRISATLHLARTVCRRAEREVVTLKREEAVNDQVGIFLNRLSDYLFLLARKANIDAGHSETEVRY